MWLFAIGGFFSIVEHKDDPNYLLVRARVKGDMERYWPNAQVQKLEDADYLYRAKLPRLLVEQTLLQIIKDIRYTSFKGAVEDKERYWTYYNRVNEEMQTMQEEYDSSNLS